MQRLALDPLPGVDPDEALTDIAYEKGRWFLSFLEQRFGREHFDPFLRAWFDRHAFQAVTTDDFMAFLRAELLPRKPGAVTEAELQAWVYGPGIPEFAVATRSAAFEAVDAARADWLAGRRSAAQLEGARWSSQEWIRFLTGMPALSQAQFAELDAAYGLSSTRNGEIAMRWYPIAVRGGYAPALAPMAEFLQRIGRRKLIMPTYTALAETREGLARARGIFERARPGYHPITNASVQSLLDSARPER